MILFSSFMWYAEQTGSEFEDDEWVYVGTFEDDNPKYEFYLIYSLFDKHTARIKAFPTRCGGQLVCVFEVHDD